MIVAENSITGSCLCGAIKYEFTGEPVNRVICHCLDCRKISGSHYADNILLTSSQLSLISGTPAQFTVPGKPDGPKDNITSHFCGKCGTTLYRTGDGFKGYVSVRCGTVDDEKFMESPIAGKGGKPQLELYGERRVVWLPEFPGVKRVEGMGQHAKSVK